eukprot:gb/GECG01010067.1/.p1 GENE.gb/GECG01010067.1/~~gb/GECG01010067.1/.p1  ORF type:complete len:2477 (+),score=252.87 gb/GECG01010067.1/:1-7431(+)
MQQFLVYRTIFFWLNICTKNFRLSSVRFVSRVCRSKEDLNDSAMFDIQSPSRSPNKSNKDYDAPDADEGTLSSDMEEEQDAELRLVRAGTAPLLETSDCITFNLHLNVDHCDQLEGYSALLMFAIRASPSISVLAGQIMVSLHLCCERQLLENQLTRGYASEAWPQSHALVGQLLSRIEDERSFHETEELNDATGWRCVYNCARIVHVVEQYVKAVESMQLDNKQREALLQTLEQSSRSTAETLKLMLQKSFASHSERCGSSSQLFITNGFDSSSGNSKGVSPDGLEEMLYMIGVLASSREGQNAAAKVDPYRCVLKMLYSDVTPCTALCFITPPRNPERSLEESIQNFLFSFRHWLPPLELEQTAYDQLFSVLELRPSSSFHNCCRLQPDALVKPVSQRVWALLMRLQTSPALEEAMEHPSEVDWKSLLEGSGWRTLYALQAVVGRLYQFSDKGEEKDSLSLCKTKSTIGWQTDFIRAHGLRIVISQFLSQLTSDVEEQGSIFLSSAIAETALRVIRACAASARDDDIILAVNDVTNISALSVESENESDCAVWFLCSTILDMVRKKTDVHHDGRRGRIKHQRSSQNLSSRSRAVASQEASEERSSIWLFIPDSFRIVNNFIALREDEQSPFPQSKLSDMLITTSSTRESLLLCLFSPELRLRRTANKQVFHQASVRSVLQTENGYYFLVLPRLIGEQLLKLEEEGMHHAEDAFSVLCESLRDCYRIVISKEEHSAELRQRIMLSYGKGLFCFLFLVFMKIASSSVSKETRSISKIGTAGSANHSTNKRPLLSENTTRDGIVHILNSMAAVFQLVTDILACMSETTSLLDCEFNADNASRLGFIAESPPCPDDSFTKELEGIIQFVRTSSLWKLLKTESDERIVTYRDVLSRFSLDLALQFTPSDSHAFYSEDLPLCKSHAERAAGYGFLRVVLAEIMRIETQEQDRDSIVDARLPLAERIVHVLRERTKSHGERHDTSWSHSYSRQSNASGYVGLLNLGCTCYINSVVQQLFMCPPFRELVLSAKLDRKVPTLPPEDTNEDTDPAQSLYKVDVENLYEPLATDSQRALRKDWVRNHTLLLELQRTFLWLSEASSKAYDPTPFLETLDVLGLPHPVFHQNDASELCEKLVDALEQRLGGTKQSHVLRRLFGGSIATERVRKCCGFTTKSESPFVYLELPVTGHHSVEESLSSQFKPEMLTGDNGLDCDKCSKKSDAEIKTSVTKLPELLILRLKRFDLDYQTFQVVKLNDQCAFPHRLDISEFYSVECPEYAKYTLKGVLVHTGNADSGHYYSFIRERESNKWFRFEDHSITPFDPQDIPTECFGGTETVKVAHKTMNYSIEEEREVERNALLLFYEKDDSALMCPDNVAEPPTQSEEKVEDEKFEPAPVEFCSASEALQRTREEIALANQYNSIQFYRYDPQFMAFLGCVSRDVVNRFGKITDHAFKGEHLVLKSNQPPLFLENLGLKLTRYFLDVIMRCAPTKCQTTGFLSHDFDPISVDRCTSDRLSPTESLARYTQYVIRPLKATSAGTLFSEGFMHLLSSHPIIGMNYARSILQPPVEAGLDGVNRLELDLDESLLPVNGLPRKLEELFRKYGDSCLSWMYKHHTPEGVSRLAELDITQVAALDTRGVDSWFFAGFVYCNQSENRSIFKNVAISGIRSASRSPYEFDVDDFVPGVASHDKQTVRMLDEHALAAASSASRRDWSWGYMSFSRDLARWKHTVRLNRFLGNDAGYNLMKWADDITHSKLYSDHQSYERVSARLVEVEHHKEYVNGLLCHAQETRKRVGNSESSVDENRLSMILERLEAERMHLQAKFGDIRFRTREKVSSLLRAWYEAWRQASVRPECPVSKLLLVWLQTVDGVSEVRPQMKEFFEFMVSLSEKDEEESHVDVSREQKLSSWDKVRGELTEAILANNGCERLWNNDSQSQLLVSPSSVVYALLFFDDLPFAYRPERVSTFFQYVASADIVSTFYGKVNVKWTPALSLLTKASVAFPHLHDASRINLTSLVFPHLPDGSNEKGQELHRQRAFLKHLSPVTSSKNHDISEFFYSIALNPTLYLAQCVSLAYEEWTKLPEAVREDPFFRAMTNGHLRQFVARVRSLCFNAKANEDYPEVFTNLLGRLLYSSAFPASLRLSTLRLMLSRSELGGGGLLSLDQPSRYRGMVHPREESTNAVRTILELFDAALVPVHGFNTELAIALATNLLNYYRDLGTRLQVHPENFPLQFLGPTSDLGEDGNPVFGFQSDVTKAPECFIPDFFCRVSDLGKYGSCWDTLLYQVSTRPRHDSVSDVGGTLLALWDRHRHRGQLPPSYLPAELLHEANLQGLRSAVDKLRLGLFAKAVLLHELKNIVGQTGGTPSAVRRRRRHSAGIIVTGAGTKTVNGHYYMSATSPDRSYYRYLGGSMFALSLSGDDDERLWTISKISGGNKESSRRQHYYVISEREEEGGHAFSVECVEGKEPVPSIRTISPREE